MKSGFSFGVLCCSVLRREVEAIFQRDYPDAQLVFLDSMLHMHPKKLHEAMEQALAKASFKSCLLIYGDCHPYMRAFERRPHCQRVEAINCCDLLLGREQYDAFRADDAFLFLPEWTERWRETFQEGLGFMEPELARQFMQEYRSRLVFLDTGITPVPEKTVTEISEYFAMPVQVLPTSLDKLRKAIASAVMNLQNADGIETPS